MKKGDFYLDFMEKVSSKCLNPPGAAGTPQMFSENRTAVRLTLEPSSSFPWEFFRRIAL